MVRFLTTLGAIFAGLLIAFGVVAAAATLMGPKQPTRMFTCFDFDQKSRYTTTEQELKRDTIMLAAAAEVPGMGMTKVYVPRSNLVGCIENQQ